MMAIKNRKLQDKLIITDRYANFVEADGFLKNLERDFREGGKNRDIPTVAKLEIVPKNGDRPFSVWPAQNLVQVISHNIRGQDYWMLLDTCLYICFSRCDKFSVASCINRLDGTLQKSQPVDFLKNFEIRRSYFDYFEIVVELQNLVKSSNWMKRKDRSNPAKKSEVIDVFKTASLPFDWRLIAPPYSTNYQKRVKRIMDIILSLLFIGFFLPLGLLIGIAIFIDSPGPILFRQKRVGHLGKTFFIYKFRTMNAKAENEFSHNHLIELITSAEMSTSELRTAYANHLDSSLTRIGRLLRKTSLDEIPQIINILKNEMSFVGPRPHPVYEVEKYKKWYYQRLIVKPGLTGLSKISLRFSPDNYEETMRLDLRYVRDWSLWLDLKIVFNTFNTILSE